MGRREMEEGQAGQETVRHMPLLVLGTALFLASSGLLNNVAFPSFDDFIPVARDVSTLFGAAFACVCSALASRTPSLLAHRASLVVPGVAALGGPLGMAAGAQLHSAVLSIVGSCVWFAAYTWVSALLGLAYLGLAPRRMALAFASAYPMKYVIVGMAGLLPINARWAVFTAMLLVTLLMVCHRSHDAAVLISRAGVAEDMSITSPLSFVPIRGKFFISMALFGFALGFAITYGSLYGHPHPAPLSFLGMLAVLLILLHMRRMSFDALYHGAFSLVLAGFLLALSAGSMRGVAGEVSNTLLYLVSLPGLWC